MTAIRRLVLISSTTIALVQGSVEQGRGNYAQRMPDRGARDDAGPDGGHGETHGRHVAVDQGRATDFGRVLFVADRRAKEAPRFRFRSAPVLALA